MVRSDEQTAVAYRSRAGAWRVTTVLDGSIDFGPEVFVGAEPGEVERLLATARWPCPRFQLPVCAFVLERDGRVLLVDAGTGTSFGEGLGRLVSALAAGGYAPDDVSAVMLTHLHPDHAFGLVQADGRPTFPAAELIVPRAEHAFWTEDANRAAVPGFMHVVFDGLPRALAPYAPRMRFVNDGEAPFDGVRCRALPGHTPGHSGYVVAEDDEPLLFWGDVCHASAVQLSRPHIGLVADVSPQRAAATRASLLAEIAGAPLRVAGAHLPFPGIGWIEPAGEGFAFRPEPFRFPARPLTHVDA